MICTDWLCHCWILCPEGHCLTLNLHVKLRKYLDNTCIGYKLMVFVLSSDKIFPIDRYFTFDILKIYILYKHLTKYFRILIISLHPCFILLWKFLFCACISYEKSRGVLFLPLFKTLIFSKQAHWPINIFSYFLNVVYAIYRNIAFKKS